MDQEVFLYQISKLSHFQILMNYSELYKRKEKEGTFFPSNFYISSQTNKDFGEIN